MKQSNFKQKYRRIITYRMVLFIFLMLGFSQIASAQVTIGVGEKSEQYATLQVKDLEKVTQSPETSQPRREALCCQGFD